MATRSVVSILIQARDQASAVLNKVSATLRGGVARSAGVVVNAVKGINGAFASVSRALSGFGFGFATAIVGSGLIDTFKNLIDLAERYEASLRRLRGAATLIGAPLDFVQAVVARGQQEFKLGGTTARNFAAELVSLAAKTGNLNLALSSLPHFLDLGAAQGLKASETLDILSSAVDGNERALRQLFNVRPEEIFTNYAAAIGKVPTELTEADRVMALFTLAQQKGALVAGTYADYLESSAGRSENLKNETKSLAGQLGGVLQPVLIKLQGALNLYLKGVKLTIANIEAIGTAVVGVFKAAGQAIVGAAEGVHKLATGDFTGAAEAVKKGASDAAATLAKSKKDIVDAYKALSGGPAAPTFDQGAVDKANKKLTASIAEQERLRRQAEAAEKARERAEQERVRREQLAEQERANRLKNEVALVAQRVGGDRQTTADVLRLSELELELKNRLKATNLVLSDRVDLEQQLNVVQQAREVLVKRVTDAEETRTRLLKDLSDEAKRRSKELIDAEHDRLTDALKVQDEVNQARNEASGNGLQNQLDDIKKFGEAYRRALLTLGRTEAQALAESQQLVTELSQQAINAELGVVDVAKQAESTLRDSFTSFFAAGIEGFSSLQQAAYDFLKSVLVGLSQLAAQVASNELFNAIFHGSTLALSASFGGPAASPSGADYASFLAEGGAIGTPVAPGPNGAPGAVTAGGPLGGGGGPTEDKSLFYGSAGEWVIKAASVRSLGHDVLRYINQTGTLPMVRAPVPAFAAGGPLGASAGAVISGAGPGGVVRIEVDHHPDVVLRVMESPAGQQVQVRTRQKHPRAFSERRRGPST